MAFPQTVLPLKVELNLGGWTDVTSYVRRDPGITITRGRANESANAERTQLTMTLENTDGRFSERNPNGAYYGLLSLNTPCRVSTTRTTKVMDLPGGDVDYATTVDAAVLDITSDIDIRFDAHLHDWRTTSVLACKWRSVSPTNQRSWAFETTSGGFLKLWWSSAGTLATVLSATSTSALPVTTGRLAVRVTLDVNNGASGNTATFYTSDTISGTWTQLGSTVIASGTTSIFSSSSAVETGGYGEAAETTAELTGASVYGWLYGFQLRSGIGGTLVANPDFTAQSVGATSFADTTSSPRTWTLTSGASLTDRHWRFHGEISSWPQTWDATRRNVTVQVTAAGVLRRLTQGSPARSVAYRSNTTTDSTVAYWPCEDLAGSSTIASGVVDGTPMAFSGSPSFGSFNEFPGASALPALNTTRWHGSVAPYTVGTLTQFQFFLYVPTGEAAGAGNVELIQIRSNSTSIRTWRIYYNEALGGVLDMKGFNSSDTEVIDMSGSLSGINEKPIVVTLDLTQTGADILWDLTWYEIGTPTGFHGFSSETSFTVGQMTDVIVNDNLAMANAVVGHIVVRNDIITVGEARFQLSGYSGETAGARFQRICTEEGLTFRSIGNLAETELMGAQNPATTVDLLRECANADFGMLFEPLDTLGLGFRTHRTLENQTPGILVDYDAHELPGRAPPIPTGDDLAVRNDVTVTRAQGSSARVELSSGRMSTAAPPAGVGRYTSSETVNVYLDEQLPSQANLRLYMGTVDEERYPQIQVDRTTPAVVANTTLNNQLLSVNVGHVLAVNDMPTPYVAPGQLQQIVQGWSERLGNYVHDFVFNTTPASTWDFGLVEDSVLGRLDTAGSQLNEDLTTTETGVDVATTSGPIWTTSAGDMPFDITVGGEVMTVTAISGGSSPQTFTVTRSVNGIVKTHSTGADVRLTHPMIFSM